MADFTVTDNDELTRLRRFVAHVAGLARDYEAYEAGQSGDDPAHDQGYEQGVQAVGYDLTSALDHYGLREE